MWYEGKHGLARIGKERDPWMGGGGMRECVGYIDESDN